MFNSRTWIFRTASGWCKVTGYNHYPSCTCGWCVNRGRNGVSRAAFRQDFRYRDAKRLLEQNGANSVAGCYVNSNARCPVCSAPVFFYANAAGSRVYFDDLGPPWPKHPCTDNSQRQPIWSGEVIKSPARRPRGLIEELLKAAQNAGLSKRQTFGHREPNQWALAVICSVQRKGEKNTVDAEFLSSDTEELCSFFCYSDVEIFSAGEFISIKGKEVSFVDRETLVPVNFTMGSRIIMGDPSSQMRPSPLSQPAGGNLLPDQHTRLIRGHELRKPARKNRVNGILPASKNDMRSAEMVHFNHKKKPFEELYRQLEPVVKKYAREGTRKPGDVALRLDAEGYRTASNARWTPRLVYFLLALIFNDSSDHKSIQKNRAKARPQKTKAPIARSSKKTTAPVTRETLAERLANKFKVSMPKSQKD